MKFSTSILLPMIFATTAGTAMAQNAPLTRAQVKAELVEAKRLGLVNVNDNDYPVTFNAPTDLGKTRAQVKADLVEAQRLGLVNVNDSNYPVTFKARTGLGKTRAQVKAELVEAQRLGLVNVNDSNYPVTVTAEQAEQIRQAGLLAAGDMRLGQLNQQ